MFICSNLSFLRRVVSNSISFLSERNLSIIRPSRFVNVKTRIPTPEINATGVMHACKNGIKPVILVIFEKLIFQI